MPGPIMNLVHVENVENVIANVEKLGGKTMMPRNEIKTAGIVTVIQDTEVNIKGQWKPQSG
jgi:predicted enzyme related to lactoylglutathione lyase